jgi:hypothetical protein
VTPRIAVSASASHCDTCSSERGRPAHRHVRFNVVVSHRTSVLSARAKKNKHKNRFAFVGVVGVVSRLCQGVRVRNSTLCFCSAILLPKQSSRWRVVSVATADVISSSLASVSLQHTSTHITPTLSNLLRACWSPSVPIWPVTCPHSPWPTRHRTSVGHAPWRVQSGGEHCTSPHFTCSVHPSTFTMVLLPPVHTQWCQHVATLFASHLTGRCAHTTPALHHHCTASPCADCLTSAPAAGCQGREPRVRMEAARGGQRCSQDDLCMLHHVSGRRHAVPSSTHRPPPCLSFPLPSMHTIRV